MQQSISSKSESKTNNENKTKSLGNEEDRIEKSTLLKPNPLNDKSINSSDSGTVKLDQKGDSKKTPTQSTVSKSLVNDTESKGSNRWTDTEDSIIMESIEHHKKKNWMHLAHSLPNRTLPQIRAHTRALLRHLKKQPIILGSKRYVLQSDHKTLEIHLLDRLNSFANSTKTPSDSSAKTSLNEQKEPIDLTGGNTQGNKKEANNTEMLKENEKNHIDSSSNKEEVKKNRETDASKKVPSPAKEKSIVETFDQLREYHRRRLNSMEKSPQKQSQMKSDVSSADKIEDSKPSLDVIEVKPSVSLRQYKKKSVKEIASNKKVTPTADVAERKSTGQGLNFARKSRPRLGQDTIGSTKIMAEKKSTRKDSRSLSLENDNSAMEVSGEKAERKAFVRNNETEVSQESTLSKSEEKTNAEMNKIPRKLATKEPSKDIGESKNKSTKGSKPLESELHAENLTDSKTTENELPNKIQSFEKIASTTGKGSEKLQQEDSVNYNLLKRSKRLTNVRDKENVTVKEITSEKVTNSPKKVKVTKSRVSGRVDNRKKRNDNLSVNETIKKVISKSKSRSIELESNGTTGKKENERNELTEAPKKLISKTKTRSTQEKRTTEESNSGDADKTIAKSSVDKKEKPSSSTITESLDKVDRRISSRSNKLESKDGIEKGSHNVASNIDTLPDKTEKKTRSTRSNVKKIEEANEISSKTNIGQEIETEEKADNEKEKEGENIRKLRSRGRRSLPSNERDRKKDKKVKRNSITSINSLQKDLEKSNSPMKMTSKDIKDKNIPELKKGDLENEVKEVVVQNEESSLSSVESSLSSVEEGEIRSGNKISKKKVIENTLKKKNQVDRSRNAVTDTDSAKNALRKRESKDDKGMSGGLSSKRHYSASSDDSDANYSSDSKNLSKRTLPHRSRVLLSEVRQQQAIWENIKSSIKNRRNRMLKRLTSSSDVEIQEHSSDADSDSSTGKTQEIEERLTRSKKQKSSSMESTPNTMETKKRRRKSPRLAESPAIDPKSSLNIKKERAKKRLKQNFPVHSLNENEDKEKITKNQNEKVTTPQAPLIANTSSTSSLKTPPFTPPRIPKEHKPSIPMEDSSNSPWKQAINELREKKNQKFKRPLLMEPNVLSLHKALKNNQLFHVKNCLGKELRHKKNNTISTEASRQIYSYDDEGYNLLMTACRTGLSKDLQSSSVPASRSTLDLDLIVRFLLEIGINVNEKGPLGLTALHLACTNGYIGIVDEFLSHGANVNIVDDLGETALHKACRVGNFPSIRLLCRDNSIDMFRQNHNHLTPFDVAGMSVEGDCSDLRLRIRIDVQKQLYAFADSYRSLIVYHEECKDHKPKQVSDWESPERLDVILDSINTFDEELNDGDALLQSCDFLRASMESLCRVHSEDYILCLEDTIEELMNENSNKILSLTPQIQRRLLKRNDEEIKEDETCDTSFSKNSILAARRAAGAVLHSIEQVMSGIHRNAFCVVRPPGHHAGIHGLIESCSSCGFCIFNNVAIGAMHAIEVLKVPRVAIIDLDVHHGNGTEEIVREKSKQYPNQLFFYSLHLYDSNIEGFRRSKWVNYHPKKIDEDYEFYPGTGNKDLLDYNIINSPIAPLWKKPRTNTSSSRTQVQFYEDPPAEGIGRGRLEVRHQFVSRLLPSLRAFNPSLILISFGCDGGRDDVGNSKQHEEGLNLEPQDYRWMTEKICQIASTCCNGRVVSVLEGGYGAAVSDSETLDRSIVGRNCKAHIEALVDPFRDNFRLNEDKNKSEKNNKSQKKLRSSYMGKNLE